jgi:recombinational DNA repair protein (RecF pathway)
MAEVLRTVECVTMVDSPEPELFELLNQTINCIANRARPEILPWFLVSMLDKMGIQPRISSRNWMNSDDFQKSSRIAEPSCRL